MRIREVRWENYRRLADGEIQVRRHLVLVGPNDTGKSSILRAINLCLGLPGAQLTTAIESRDFTDESRDLRLRVVLEEFDADDRAAFPDEITTIGSESLLVQVEASMIDGDSEQKQVRRQFPMARHGRSPSRRQMDRFRWAYVPATRSLYRELGTSGTGAVRSLLAAVDLQDDRPTFDAANEAFRSALEEAEALKGFRRDLAESLSSALPRAIAPDDLKLTSESDLLDDPLADVTVTIADGAYEAPLAEQSDGIRALSVLTLLGMSQRAAEIVGIDEPEIHLHYTAQRAVARRFRHAPGQRVLVTHSPSVVQEMDPLDIVRMDATRAAFQLGEHAPIANSERTTRHWAPRMIEPLTARAVLIVEGVSDRILCDRVAELLGLDLNRAGVSILELDGSGLFQLAYELFGPPGFQVPVFGLADEDASAEWAEVLGVSPTDLDADGHYSVCDPDLEGHYVCVLGVNRVLQLLSASPHFQEGAILSACGTNSSADLTEASLSEYCRHKRRKVRAALAVAAGLTDSEASALTAIVNAVRAAQG